MYAVELISRQERQLIGSLQKKFVLGQSKRRQDEWPLGVPGVHHYFYRMFLCFYSSRQCCKRATWRSSVVSFSWAYLSTVKLWINDIEKVILLFACVSRHPGYQCFIWHKKQIRRCWESKWNIRSLFAWKSRSVHQAFSVRRFLCATVYSVFVYDHIICQSRYGNIYLSITSWLRIQSEWATSLTSCRVHFFNLWSVRRPKLSFLKKSKWSTGAMATSWFSL